MTLKNSVLALLLCIILSNSGCTTPLPVKTERGAAHQVSAERMEQFNDWKFGLFLHWGPWAQSEDGKIWRGQSRDGELQNDAEQIQKNLDLNKTFNPVDFDPADWAALAKEAGIRYVVFTAKHHDGFCNWDTKQTDYRVTHPDCPYSANPKADITKNLTDAFRKENLAIGYYYSHTDQHHPDGNWWWRHLYHDPDFVTKFPKRWANFAKFETEQVRELLTGYGRTDIFWFDIEWPHGDWYGTAYNNKVVRKDALDLVNMIRRIDPDIIVNDRGTDVLGDFATPEQQVPDTGVEGYWEANITISNGGGYWYRGPDSDYKTTPQLIRMLVDIAAKGGNFLMNIGPRPDGTFSPQEIEGLKGIGKWMNLNSESIYGTRRSPLGKLEWGKCTAKDNKLYLHVFNWPKNRTLTVPGLRSTPAKAYLLAGKKPLDVSGNGLDTFITVPKKQPHPVNTVIALEIEGDLDVETIARQDSKGTVELTSGKAELSGPTIKYFWGSGTHHGGYIQNWKSPQDSLTWQFRIDTPGTFQPQVNRVDAADSGEYTISVNAKTLHAALKADDKIIASKGKQKIRQSSPTTITLNKPGIYTLTIKPKRIDNENLMMLKEIKLIKTKFNN